MPHKEIFGLLNLVKIVIEEMALKLNKNYLKLDN